jgi:hypothetical protein
MMHSSLKKIYHQFKRDQNVASNVEIAVPEPEQIYPARIGLYFPGCIKAERSNEILCIRKSTQSTQSDSFI